MVISQVGEHPSPQGRGGEDTLEVPVVSAMRWVSSECRRALVLADGLEQVSRSCGQYPGIPVLARTRLNGSNLARVRSAFERGASLISVSARVPPARMRKICRIAAGCGGGVLVEIPREGFHPVGARGWREAGVEYVLVPQLEPQETTFGVEVSLDERVDQLADLGFTVVLAVDTTGEGPHEFVDNPVGLVVAGDLLPLRPPPATEAPQPRTAPETARPGTIRTSCYTFIPSPTVSPSREEEHSGPSSRDSRGTPGPASGEVLTVGLVARLPAPVGAASI